MKLNTPSRKYCDIGCEGEPDVGEARRRLDVLGRGAASRWLLLPLGGLLWIGCQSSDPAEQTAAYASGSDSQTVSRISVQVAEVTIEDVVEIVKLTGTAQSWDEFAVSSEIPGKVVRIHVEEGEFVREGDLLLELDQEKIALELRSREAQLERERVDVVYAKKKLARGQALLEKGAISRSELDSLEQVAELADSAVDLAQISVDSIQEELEDTWIYSPVAGQVSRRNISLGETVNSTTPLFTIIQVDPIKIVTQIAESDLGVVRIGQEARVVFDALSESVFEGRIRQIHPVTNPLSGAFPVEIRVANPRHKVQPGMIARLQVSGRSFPQALLAPMDGVVDLSGRKFVFVVG